MWEIGLTANIVIFDSQGEKHLLKGDQDCVKQFLYNPILWHKPTTEKAFLEEKQFIEHFKKQWLRISGPDYKKAKVISMGAKNEAGGLVISKPSSKIFWYHKENQKFFNWRYVELKNFLSNNENKESLEYLINNQWSSIIAYKPVSMTRFQPINKKLLNSLSEVISLIKNQKDPVVYVNMPIDFKNFDYELKIYNSRSFDQFRQMAVDMTWDGIHLAEREQHIWRNKLMALLPSHTPKSEKDKLSKEFYDQLNIKIQYEKLQETITHNNENADRQEYKVKNKKRIL